MNNKPKRSHQIQDRMIKIADQAIDQALKKIENFKNTPAMLERKANQDLKDSLAKRGVRPGSMAYRMEMRRQQIINKKKKA